MAEAFVGGAFLSSVFQVIRVRLVSLDFIDYPELVKKLEITLSSMYKVLDYAETKQYQNPKVKNWLDDLKHVLYEVEHLLDVIANDAQRMGKIRRFISASINRFESRIKVLLKRLNVLVEQKNLLGLQEDRYEIGVSRQLLSKNTTVSLVDESVIYGREHDKAEIIHFLLEASDCGNQVPIISIVGLIGMGKTTLAQLVYNYHRMTEQFKIKAWVDVPEYYDLFHITK
ncbi:hypothetical protein P8452_24612 [Trifolium repens]|jgi:hypothetical protein|nr:hypothetical protein P8452_24612 [Trifolium repens]